MKIVIQEEQLNKLALDCTDAVLKEMFGMPSKEYNSAKSEFVEKLRLKYATIERTVSEFKASIEDFTKYHTVERREDLHFLHNIDTELPVLVKSMNDIQRNLSMM